jgi:hypothetical protein
MIFLMSSARLLYDSRREDGKLMGSEPRCVSRWPAWIRVVERGLAWRRRFSWSDFFVYFRYLINHVLLIVGFLNFFPIEGFRAGLNGENRLLANSSPGVRQVPFS